MVDSVGMIGFFPEINPEPKTEILRFTQDDMRTGGDGVLLPKKMW